MHAITKALVTFVNDVCVINQVCLSHHVDEGDKTKPVPMWMRGRFQLAALPRKRALYKYCRALVPAYTQFHLYLRGCASGNELRCKGELLYFFFFLSQLLGLMDKLFVNAF